MSAVSRDEMIFLWGECAEHHMNGAMDLGRKKTRRKYVAVGDIHIQSDRSCTSPPLTIHAASAVPSREA